MKFASEPTNRRGKVPCDCVGCLSNNTNSPEMSLNMFGQRDNKTWVGWFCGKHSASNGISSSFLLEYSDMRALKCVPTNRHKGSVLQKAVENGPCIMNQDELLFSNQRNHHWNHLSQSRLIVVKKLLAENHEPLDDAASFFRINTPCLLCNQTMYQTAVTSLSLVSPLFLLQTKRICFGLMYLALFRDLT